MNMLQVIQAGAAQTVKGAETKCCPWCGEAPPLAALVAGKFIVACENEDCSAQPQVSATSLAGAWAKWNARVTA